jgi:hypothetical protein
VFNAALEELPEALDQVQVRRVGWQVEQFDAEGFGGLHHYWCVVVAGVVENNQQALAGVRLSREQTHWAFWPSASKRMACRRSATRRSSVCLKRRHIASRWLQLE